MAVVNRDLKAGMNLVATYKQDKYRIEVVDDDNGNVRFAFPDGRVFKSPSGAGKAITGKSCNGWAILDH